MLGSMEQHTRGGCSSTLGSGKVPWLGHRGGDTDGGYTEVLHSGRSKKLAADAGSRKRQ